MSSVTKLNCPTCKTQIEWTDKFPFRPFCCQRCQQIDFGGWAQESFAIKGAALIDPEVMDSDQLAQELLNARMIDPDLLDS